MVGHRGQGPSGENCGATSSILTYWDPGTLPHTAVPEQALVDGWQPKQSLMDSGKTRRGMGHRA